MRIATIALSVLATTFISNAMADDAPKRSPELQVLNRFVGTWDLDVTHKFPQGKTTTEKAAEIRKWTLGGSFVHFQNLRTEKKDAPEFHFLVTYDAKSKSYPGVMSIGSNRSLVKGVWDNESRTMTFTGTFSDGGSFEFQNRFLDNGNTEATGVIKDRSGKLVVERSDTQVRRKK
jgi:hypothetical protein